MSKLYVCHCQVQFILGIKLSQAIVVFMNQISDPSKLKFDTFLCTQCA